MHKLTALTPLQMISKLSAITKDFYSRNSYGKLKLNLVPFYKWLRMSKPSTECIDSGVITFYKHRAYLQEVADLASSNGFNFSKLDLIVVLTNPAATAIHIVQHFVQHLVGVYKLVVKIF